MKSLIHDDFLLQNPSSRELFHRYAEIEPIIDYHCHLSPKDIAENRRFQNLFEIWLEGDHYKWRLMRTNGVPERFCTGDATPKEKYLAFANTVPATLRNPMYHWCQLELKRYFDIDLSLNVDTAERIWDMANERLTDPAFSVSGIFQKFRVKVVGTTDDPIDDLRYHKQIAENLRGTAVVPTYRPDKAMKTENFDAWRNWVNRLEEVAGFPCDSLDGFLEALKSRHDYFHALGARLSDHGLEYCPCDFPTEYEAGSLFLRLRHGDELTPQDRDRFAAYLMLFWGGLDAGKGWTKQLHLGAMRNNNTRLLRQLGPDTGFDSIGDWPQARGVSRYLDRLDLDGKLPKVVLYNLNPADNYLFATMLGNFQDGSLAGKIQFGSGWWFLDQLEGMTLQINALSNLGLLSRFVGMLTDSRSFLSYCRHEYFRRLLCQMLGDEMEKGLLPMDFDLVGGMVRDICYGNAARYFGFNLPE